MARVSRLVIGTPLALLLFLLFIIFFSLVDLVTVSYKIVTIYGEKKADICAISRANNNIIISKYMNSSTVNIIKNIH